MILIFLLLASCVGFTYLLTVITNNTSLIWAWALSSVGITLVLLLFFVYCVFIPIFKKLSPTNKFKHKTARQFMFLIMLFSRTCYKVEGRENLVKKSKEPLIFVGNHKTLLDGPWIYAMLNRPHSVVAKDTLLKNPFFKPIMKAFHVVTIDRNNDRSAAKSIIEGSKLIKQGLPILLFPEGGIKSRETGQMITVRPGAYKLATRANATIQPLVIHNSTGKRKRIPFSWTKITIKVLEPITSDFYADKNTIELGLEIAKRTNATFNEKQVEVEVL